MKQLQRDDALKTIEVLEATRKSHVMRLKYYLTLTEKSTDKVLVQGHTGKTSSNPLSNQRKTSLS